MSSGRTDELKIQNPNCRRSIYFQCLKILINTNLLPIQFNSIQFYLYSAITIQLSQGALQSPDPEPLVQAQWQQEQEKTPC